MTAKEQHHPAPSGEHRPSPAASQSAHRHRWQDLVLAIDGPAAIFTCSGHPVCCNQAFVSAVETLYGRMGAAPDPLLGVPGNLLVAIPEGDVLKAALSWTARRRVPFRAELVMGTAPDGTQRRVAVCIRPNSRYGHDASARTTSASESASSPGEDIDDVLLMRWHLVTSSEAEASEPEVGATDSEGDPQSDALGEPTAMALPEFDVFAATEAGGVGLWSFDFQRDLGSWSPQACEILGVLPPGPPHADDYIRQIPVPDRTRVQALLERQRQRGVRRIALTHRIRRPDGAVRWVRINGEIIEWEPGELGDVVPIRSVGTMVDITDRMRLDRTREQVFRDLHVRHRRLVELFNDAPFFVAATHGPEHAIEFANPACHRLLGRVWRRGQPLAEVLSGICDDELLDRIHGVYETGVALHRDGVRFNRLYGVDPLDPVSAGEAACIVNLVVQPIEDTDGTVTGLNLHGIDVTQEVLARKALQHSEERLELAMRGSNAGLWDLTLDPNNPLEVRTTYLSPRTKEIIGFAPDEFPHSIRAWRERVLSEDLPRLNEAATAYRDQGAPRYEVTYRIRHRDGGIRWVRSTGRIFRDRFGRPQRWTGITTDVTEVKQAELELRRSEQFYRTIGETIPFGVWNCDEHGQLTYVSESFLRMVGRNLEDVRGHAWLDLLVDGTAEQTLRDWRACCAEGRDWEHMHLFRGADGTLHHVMSSGRPVRDERGKIEGWVGINLDMTSQMKTQAALLESERRLARQLAEVAAIYNSAPVGLCYFDRNLRYININERLAAMDGYPVGDHLGRTLRDLRPDIARHIEPLLRRVLESGEAVFDHELSLGRPDDPDEPIRSWLITCHPVCHDGDDLVVGVNTVVHDVTSIREAERALAETEERFRLAIDAARAMVYASEITPGRLLWMHGVERLVGEEPVLPCDRSWWRSRVHPDDLDRVENIIRSATASGQDYKITYRVRHAHGHLVDVDEHTSMVRDQSGRAVRHVGVVIDITSRRRAEEMLRESESNLRLAVMASPFPTIIHAEDGRIVLVNAMFTQLTGYRPEDVPTVSDWLRYAFGHRASDMKQRIDQLYGSQQPRHDGDLPLVTASGEERIWPFSSPPLGRDLQGNRLVLTAAADLTDRLAAHRRAELLTAELNHRVKNTLATVLSICRQTGRHTDSFDAFRRAFEGRLLALAQAHSLLSAHNWSGIDLRNLVTSALEPFVAPHAGSLSVSGPPFEVQSRLALTLTLALHELATNAAKHGTLTVADGGRVQISWRIERGTTPEEVITESDDSNVAGNDSPEASRAACARPGLLHLEWSEAGGPPVEPPTHRGFGSRLLERTIQYEFGGEVALRYERAGVQCSIRIPLDRTLDVARPEVMPATPPSPSALPWAT